MLVNLIKKIQLNLIIIKLINETCLVVKHWMIHNKEMNERIAKIIIIFKLINPQFIQNNIYYNFRIKIDQNWGNKCKSKY